MRNCLLLAMALAVGALLAPIRPAAAEGLILNTQDFAPFSYLADGAVAGPAADVIRRVCADAKIECTLKLLPWRRAQQEVEEGKAHGMFVIGWNAERSKWLYFSPPLLTTEYGFFVRSDSPLAFRQNADVKGYTVGVYGPSNTATALEKVRAEVGDLMIDMTPDDEAAFKKLSLGRVDAVFSNKDVGRDLVRRFNLANIRYAGRQQSLKYYIGFSQKFTDARLVEQFNATFRNLYRQGAIQAILGKHGMDAAAPE
jgi:polar amino acid transport system substrate-binding protein